MTTMTTAVTRGRTRRRRYNSTIGKLFDVSQSVRMTLFLFFSLSSMSMNQHRNYCHAIEMGADENLLTEDIVKHDFDQTEYASFIKEKDDTCIPDDEILYEENGLLVLTKVEDILAVVEDHNAGTSFPSLMLLVVYSSSCPHSQESLFNVEQATAMLSDYFATTNIIANNQLKWETQASYPRPQYQPVRFAKLDADHIDTTWLQQTLQLKEYPSLVLVRKSNNSNNDDSNNNALILDYVGKQSTGTEIFHTVLHYWSRYALNDFVSSSVVNDEKDEEEQQQQQQHQGEYEEYSPIFALASYRDMVSFLESYGRAVLRHVAPALHPLLTPNEKRYISWLLEPESSRTDSDDDFILFVQCRSSPSSRDQDQELPPSLAIEDSLITFDLLADNMNSRRDVAFFTLTECNGMVFDDGDQNEIIPGRLLQDGEVVALYVPSIWIGLRSSSSNSSSSTSAQYDKYWANLPSTAVRFLASPHDNRSNTQRKMTQFVVEHATPDVMWFDRKSVAPLAFPLYRKIHAVLFVNMHHVELQEGFNDEELYESSRDAMYTRSAIQNLRKAAIAHRRSHPTDDMVSLIVPSTETRIMNTFGIDIWTPLDDIASKQKQKRYTQDEDDPTIPTTSEQQRDDVSDDEPVAVLPILLITDQRNSGATHRYYLDSGEIIHGPSSTIDSFIGDFWNGRLEPEIQSQHSKDAIAVNKSGVQSVTGETFEALVLDRFDKHTLLFFFAPTCGHCKRFSVVWNELSRLIRYLKWDSFIDVMKMDITRNEIVSNRVHLDIQVTPELYYFPLGAAHKVKAVKFDILDEFGDEAGRLSDALEILDWLLDVSKGRGGLEEEDLLKLLEGIDSGLSKKTTEQDQAEKCTKDKLQ